MKASNRLVLAAAAAASLAACATTDDGYATAPPGVHVTDTEYVAAVEQMADTQGVRVVWINPPAVRSTGDED